MLPTAIIFTPLIGMIIVLLLPRENENQIKWVTLGVTMLPLLLAFYSFVADDRLPVSEKFEDTAFIRVNIPYHAVNGLMPLLTALLGPICVGALWKIDKRVQTYMALFLLLETGMLGFFFVLEPYLFYRFYNLF